MTPRRAIFALPGQKLFPAAEAIKKDSVIHHVPSYVGTDDMLVGARAVDAGRPFVPGASKEEDLAKGTWVGGGDD